MIPTGWWQTIHICRACGKVGIISNDKLAGRYVLYCPGCGALKSRSSFKMKEKLVDEDTCPKTKFIKNGIKQTDISGRKEQV